MHVILIERVLSVYAGIIYAWGIIYVNFQHINLKALSAHHPASQWKVHQVRISVYLLRIAQMVAWVPANREHLFYYLLHTHHTRGLPPVILTSHCPEIDHRWTHD